MYCIVIKDYDGNYHREVVENLPTEKDLAYWEKRYKVHTMTSSFLADAINVFEIAKELS